MTAPTVTAWAIKAPDGEILSGYIRGTEEATKKSAGYWEQYEIRGYRCVKVHITEMEDGK